MVHDTCGGGHDNVTELSCWQQVVGPSVDVVDLDVESWLDDTTLVQSTVQLDDDLTGSVVVDVFEFTDVTVLLHDGQELDDDLGGWSDQDLSLTGFFGVVDCVKSICEDGGSGHCGWLISWMGRFTRKGKGKSRLFFNLGKSLFLTYVKDG